MTAALKREVGSSVYIGWVSSLLLLLGGALICIVCGQEEGPRPPQYLNMPNSSMAPLGGSSSRPASVRSGAMRSDNSRMNRDVQSQPQTYSSLNTGPNVYRVYSQSQWTQPGSYRS